MGIPISTGGCIGYGPFLSALSKHGRHQPLEAGSVRLLIKRQRREENQPSRDFAARQDIGAAPEGKPWRAQRRSGISEVILDGVKLGGAIGNGHRHGDGIG
jgi:hypothetical protein